METTLDRSIKDVIKFGTTVGSLIETAMIEALDAGATLTLDASQRVTLVDYMNSRDIDPTNYRMALRWSPLGVMTWAVWLVDD